MRAALVVLLLLAAPALAAPPTSDAARLNVDLGPDFTRTTVWILPPLDHRPLLGAETAPVPALEGLIEGLQGYANLDVRTPDRTSAAIAGSTAYRRALPLARAAATRGTEDYRQVRLAVAIEGLGQAVEAFIDIGHDVVAGTEVGRTELTRGLALLEKGDEVGAAAALRRSLLLAPGVRLRRGVDRQAAVDAQERARVILAENLPAAPAVFAHRPPVPGKAATLQIRILPDRLEVVLHEGGRVVTDVQLLDAPDAGQRLAGRLWACLPFGDAPRRRVSPRRLHLDAGFAWFVYTKAPVELFGNVGVSATASWSVARYLALEASAALTNSGRDREEDLRAEVPVGRFTAGPAFATDAGRLRAVAGVGVEVAVIGPVETTTNPACKYFRPGDVPARLCDFDQDVDQRETAWAVGPTVTLGASLRLVDAIYLGVRAQGAVYVFRTLDNGLDRPVGGQLVLGYQLF